jgi:hypothetical protein
MNEINDMNEVNEMNEVNGMNEINDWPTDWMKEGMNERKNEMEWMKWNETKRKEMNEYENKPMGT